MNIGSILNESERDDRKNDDTDPPGQDCDSFSNRRLDLDCDTQDSQPDRHRDLQTNRNPATILPPLAPPSAASSSTVASSSGASDTLRSVDYRQYPSPLMSASPSFQRVGFDPPSTKHVLPSVDPSYSMQSGARYNPSTVPPYTSQFQSGEPVFHGFASTPSSGSSHIPSYQMYSTGSNAIPSGSTTYNRDSSSPSYPQQQNHRYPPLPMSNIGNYRDYRTSGLLTHQPFRISPDGQLPNRTLQATSPFDPPNRIFQDSRSPEIPLRDQTSSGDYSSSSSQLQTAYSTQHPKSQARSARRQSWPYEVQDKSHSPGGPTSGLNISGSKLPGSSPVIRQSPSTAPVTISDGGDPPGEEGNSAQEIPLVYISAARDLRKELTDMNDQRKGEIEQSSKDKGMPVITMQRIITQCCDSLSESVLNRVSSRMMPVARGLFRVPRPRNSFMIYKSTLHTCLRELERVGSNSCFGSSSIEQINQPIKPDIDGNATPGQESKQIGEMPGQLNSNPDSVGYTGNDRVGMAQFTQAIGILWQTETRNMKMVFQQLAVGESKLHRQLYPTYKFSPTSRKRSKRRPVAGRSVEPNQEDGAITDS